MDDQMIDLMAGDELLRRRLLAYADLRLSPDLTTSSRLRARVMAVAHRHASLARADAGLTLLPRPDGVSGAHPSDELGVAARAARRPSGTRHGRRQRAMGVLLAASLAAVMVAGGVYAARPGGPLYETRLWAETLTLPSDPSARAMAELDRLRERLREIGEASRSGDTWGVMAALAAYESIVEEASASAILSDDDVAAAVLETGVGRNVEVLRALAARVPATAGVAITRAVDAAIARSADAVERIHASRPERRGQTMAPGVGLRTRHGPPRRRPPSQRRNPSVRRRPGRSRPTSRPPSRRRPRTPTADPRAAADAGPHAQAEGEPGRGRTACHDGSRSPTAIAQDEGD